MLLGRFLESCEEMVGKLEAVETNNCPECGNKDSENEKDVAGSVEDSIQERSLEDRGRGEMALV